MAGINPCMFGSCFYINKFKRVNYNARGNARNQYIQYCF